MNKIQSFKNAQEFQELFGIQEHNNGVKNRRNKILLALYWKQYLILRLIVNSW